MMMIVSGEDNAQQQQTEGAPLDLNAEDCGGVCVGVAKRGGSSKPNRTREKV